MCLRGRQTQLVTNDEFRDHFWRMRQPTAFSTWRERHLTRYHILSERPEDLPPEDADAIAAARQITSAQLFPPPTYSHCAQEAAGSGCWHFPVRLPETPAPPAAATAPAL